jgi:hypothetical protein
MGVIMLTAVKLVDQWREVERSLPPNWEEARLRVRTEQPEERGEAARILGPLGVGHVGDELAVTVRRAGGSSGPEAARRLFGYLDDARVWCILEHGGTTVSESEPAAATAAVEAPAAETWDAALAPLPSDWSDLLCELAIESSDELDRVALLCAPVNPARDGDRLAFTFRCARRAGYGVSPAMARRCFERLDAEGIPARARVLRLLSETDNVGTQGTVWLVGGRSL